MESNGSTTVGDKRKREDMGSDGERDAARVKVEHDEPETLRPDAQDVAVAVDEDGIPLVENPSEDIIIDLESAVGMDFNFQGSFAWVTRYTDAPNPALRLEGLGTVGVPLGDVSARAFAELCRTQTHAGESAGSHTWSLDATNVQFENPAWLAFITRVHDAACHALGVDDTDGATRCVLRKLTLCEPGARFPPDVAAQASENAFASVLVALPSRFATGSAKLSYQQRSMQVDLGHSSVLQTSVLAWYNGVEQKATAVASGHCFALLYDLELPRNDAMPRPIPPSEPLVITTLRHTLLSWKQNEEDPQKVVFMLGKDYTRRHRGSVTPSASVLENEDSRLLELLDGIAQELGFCLGLATLCHNVKGTRKGTGWMGRWERELDEDEDEMDSDTEEDPETYLYELFDLDGKLILAEPDWDESEVVPTQWEEVLRDDEDFDRDVDDENIEYSYRRTAIVVWPRSRAFASGGGDRRPLYALRCFEVSQTSQSPSTEDERFFQCILAALSLPQERALKVLCNTSRRWRRLDLWRAAVLSGRGYTTAEEAIHAISTFSFENVQPCIEHLVRSDSKNSSRFAFLDALMASAVALKSGAAREAVADLVQAQKAAALKNIKQPSQNDMDVLTVEALRQGGASYIQDVILPQVLANANLDFLEVYATFLYAGIDRFAADYDERFLILDVITALLAVVAKKKDFFALVRTATYRTSIYPTPQLAFDFVKECVDLCNTPTAASVIARLVNMHGLAKDVSRVRASRVLLPLVRLLGRFIKDSPSPPELDLCTLCSVAVEHSMEVDGCRGAEWIDAILEAVVLSGDAHIFASVALPRLKTMRLDAATTKYLIETLHLRQTEPAFSTTTSSSLDATLQDLVQTYARTIYIPATLQRWPESTRSQDLPGDMKFCYHNGGAEALAILVSRVLAADWVGTSSATHVAEGVVKELRALADARGQPLSSQPFASAFCCVLRKWMQQVLARGHTIPKANTALQALAQHACIPSCHCVHKYWQESIIFRHVPQVPVYYTATGRRSWSKKAMNAQPPPPNDNWNANKRNGFLLILGMADEAELAGIFQEAYRSIATLFGGLV